ncbi:MAG TPA: S41 family peptidase [Pyrinomonadaceae bacterium]|nr:S41 family peptidase [Pyrinomonadaceae bacterium]
MKDLLLNIQRCAYALVVIFATLTIGTLNSARGQGLALHDRDNAESMLRAAKDDLKKYYYDPSFHGLDLETKFKEAQEKLKQATTRDQLVIAVAQALLDFNDSHTFFIPPSRAARVQYGWEMQIIGDNAYVSAVKPGSDADARGLKAGDEILSVDGFRPNRENMWKMYYRYYALMPARSIRLVVKHPGASDSKEIDALAKIERSALVTDWSRIFHRYLREGRDQEPDRLYEVGKELFIWKMPSFVVSEAHVSDIMGRAKNFKFMILDLRGNGGGYVDTLARLAGYFFEADVKIADLKGRKEMKPVIAKTRGASGFKGDLIVLVDSDSGSASELFARLVQIEKRGKVIGDRTAGSVKSLRTSKWGRCDLILR